MPRPFRWQRSVGSSALTNGGRHRGAKLAEPSSVQRQENQVLTLTSRRSPWYAQERRDTPPFVCTYMGRHRDGRPPIRILWNRSRAVAANVYLLLYPEGALRRAIEARPALDRVVFGRLRDIRPAHFIDEGRVYGGGLHKMEPGELAALPADAILEAISPPAAPVGS